MRVPAASPCAVWVAAHHWFGYGLTFSGGTTKTWDLGGRWRGEIMRYSSFAKEVIGPDDVTFSHLWILAGFLVFGIVAFAYNAWLIRKSEERSFKQGCILAFCATGYLGLTLYGFVWALVHAIDNG